MLAALTLWGAFKKYRSLGPPPKTLQISDSISLEGECVCQCQLLSRVRLFVTLWTGTCQTPLSMGFSRQEYWSGLPFPSPGDLPDPRIESVSLALAGGFFTTQPPRKPFDSGTDPLFKTWSCDSKVQATPSTMFRKKVLFSSDVYNLIG